MKTVWIPGRFQPPHVGHKAMIDKALGEGAKVCVLVRDTDLDDDNPFTYKERLDILREWYGDGVHICLIPDPDCELEIWAGRGVGWKYREVRLDPEVEEISATKIREGLRKAGVI